MTIDADILLDRYNLKRRLRKWQIISLAFLLVLLLVVVSYNSDKAPPELGSDYIGRVEISGVIIDDLYREEVLKKAAENDKIKALIVRIDSPGGTTLGGEALYNQIKQFSDNGKPVVVVMRTLATSAGYMAAMGGDHVVARKGTITGSIGVIIQSAEFTELAEKIGVNFRTFKSGDLKASPSPFEKTSPKAAAAMDSVIQDSFDFFIGLVAEKRNLDVAEVKKISDGRIFTGSQALKIGLIDEIGGEDEAVAWLVANKEIADDLDIKDIKTVEPEKGFAEVFFGNPKKSSILGKLEMNGLLSIWDPNI